MLRRVHPCPSVVPSGLTMIDIDIPDFGSLTHPKRLTATLGA
jgi:hypothetical protein